MSQTPPSPRTQVRRKPQRAHYDRETVEAIVDQALVCHIAFNEGGSVHCLPTACWREGDHLYIHGANNSRLMGAVLSGQCAVAITLLDGLVMARSAFRHSMNYRSAVIYGQFVEVEDPDEKLAAMEAFLDHVAPGRPALVRPPSAAEVAGTRLARIALTEAAAKIRNWGPEDAEADLGIPVWAGVVPLALRAGTPRPESGSGGHNPPRVPAFID